MGRPTAVRSARGATGTVDLNVRFSTPRALYVHVPFCRRRCGYCNFAITTNQAFTVDFFRALRLELNQIGSPLSLDTVFIGGGTPSTLPVDQWRQLLDMITELTDATPLSEWTIEANPEDLAAPDGAEKVSLAAERGVTRWSLGVQSFLASKRANLERVHTNQDVDQAIALCRQAGGHVAVDLIFAAPQESLADWRRDLAELLRRDVDHVSTYGLTYEKGAPFWGRLRRGELRPVPEDEERSMYLAARSTLVNAGFEHYEVSNYARPGKGCRHNETYWQCRPYYAVGPGAARYVNGVREVNHRSTTTWMRRLFHGESAVAEREVIDAELAARERLVFGLRMLDGLRLDLFYAETGYRVEQLCGATLDDYVRAGWWQVADGKLSLTTEGILISDSLWPALLAPA